MSFQQSESVRAVQFIRLVLLNMCAVSCFNIPRTYDYTSTYIFTLILYSWTTLRHSFSWFRVYEMIRTNFFFSKFKYQSWIAREVNTKKNFLVSILKFQIGLPNPWKNYSNLRSQWKYYNVMAKNLIGMNGTCTRALIWLQWFETCMSRKSSFNLESIKLGKKCSFNRN